MLVAHTYNPSYSGGRDQEDHGSKPAWGNNLRDPILKKHCIKKGWWSGSSVGPEFNPQHCKKKKKLALRIEGRKVKVQVYDIGEGST
jgi:hypothetical protein